MKINMQIMCIKHEIKRRKAIFPILVKNNKITEEYAVAELHLMQSVLETLTQVKGIVL